MENSKVIFRNNSNLSWLKYNVGGGNFIDIVPKSIFSVGPKAAIVLRKNLCDNPEEGASSVWLEEITEKDLIEKEVKGIKKDAVKVDQVEVEKIKVEEAKNKKKK